MPSSKCVRARAARRGAPFALLLVALLVAMPAFAGVATHPQTTMDPHSEFGDWLNSLFFQITWWEVGIFVVVAGWLLLAIIRFRAHPDRHPARDVHGHTLLEFGWTLAPAVVLAFIAVPTVRTIFRTQAPAAANALHVRVVGHQWWWEFQYPELGIVTANELHLPLGRTADFELTSADVIHSFWLPALGGKRDLEPGRVNHLWFTPKKEGMFPGQCAEFCGASHANMRMRAFVETPEQFDAWAAAQKGGPAVTAPTDTTAGTATGDAAAGAKVFATGLCVTCHTVQSVSAGVIGPNLTHVGSRTTIAGGTLANTPENMARWLKDPPAAKPGALMPNLGLNDTQISSLVAYLESLK
jgi:cytochrome c oxidase subunit 2